MNKNKYWIYPYEINGYSKFMNEPFTRRSNWEKIWQRDLTDISPDEWDLIWKLADNYKFSTGDIRLSDYMLSLRIPDSKIHKQMTSFFPYNYFITNKGFLPYTLPYAYAKGANILKYILPYTIVVSPYTTLKDYKNFKKDHKPGDLYILKPESLYGGMGIEFYNDLDSLTDKINNIIGENFSVQNYTRKNEIKFSTIDEEDSWIIQKYIKNPLLLEGRKFDIRVNVLMNNIGDIYFSPVIFVRTSSLEYKPYFVEDEKINKVIHVTNNAFQKLLPDYFGKYEEGNILLREQLQQYFDLSYGKNTINIVRDFFPRWKELIIDTINSLVIKTENINNKDGRKHFQYFGFDFMIDENFKTWLIEVNQNPSLTWETKWSEDYLPFFMEEIVKNGVDPFFYAGNIRPLKNKFPKIPELPWADKVTKKELPNWFIPVNDKIPIIKDHSFELIYSLHKFLHNIPHQKYILNKKEFEDLGTRVAWFRGDEKFYYPFGKSKKAKSRSKSPVKTKSRSKSPVKTKSRSKSPVKTKSRSKSPVKAKSKSKSPVKSKSKK
jgi:hypothetical protein